MSIFIDRLSQFMEIQGINDNQMTIKAGLSNGLLGKAKNGKGNISCQNIEKILLAYPDLSAEWLMTGNGTMLYSQRNITPKAFNNLPLIDADERQQHSITPQDNTDLKPRITFSAEAGALSIITDSVAFDECPKFPTITIFPRYDFTIIIHGDSMEPEFKSGDEVACQIVKDPNRIQWGRTHILDTMDGVVLKRIYDHKGSILCRSINSEYSDFTIPKRDVLKVALVVGTIRRY